MSCSISLRQPVAIRSTVGKAWAGCPGLILADRVVGPQRGGRFQTDPRPIGLGCAFRAHGLDRLAELLDKEADPSGGEGRQDQAAINEPLGQVLQDGSLIVHLPRDPTADDEVKPPGAPWQRSFQLV